MGGAVFFLDAAPTFEDCIFMQNEAVNGGAVRAFGTNANADFVRCEFSSNSATRGGAMILRSGASPTLQDCTFNQNTGSAGGGAINIQQANTSPVLRRCQFDQNFANLGGAIIIFDRATPTLEDCTFTDNSASADGGAINIQQAGTTPVLRRCRFDLNSALFGGAMIIAFNAVPILEACDFTQNSANSPNAVSALGGAILIAGGSTPTLDDCTFTGNVTTDDGGAIAVHTSNPNITRCVFTSNQAEDGGAVYHWDAAPTYVGCDFDENSAIRGGGAVHGVRAATDPWFENCRFFKNVSKEGGAVRTNANSTFVNCLFTDNVAAYWGAALDLIEAGTTSIINSTFVRNTSAPKLGGAIRSAGGRVTFLDNCIVWGNIADEVPTAIAQILTDEFSSTVVTNSIVQQDCGDTLGPTVYDADPMFVDPDGADDIVGNDDDNFRLSLFAPLIDLGNNTPTGGLSLTDLDGNPRVMNGTVDLGAYEHQDPCVAPDDDGDGICDTFACRLSSCAATPEVVVAKNRFLSFSAGDPGQIQAVRVIFESLPAPYDLWNGSEMWVGPTSQVSEGGANVAPTEGLPNFTAARLQCARFYANWSSLGTIHVLHEGIVPGGSYRVDVIDDSCDAGVPTFSLVLPLATAIWGDTVLDLSEDPPLPPGGPPVDIVDALAILERFSNAPGAIIKARADLEPACVDLKINVADVLSSLAGFSGLSYPFAPTAADPCNSTCPNVLP
ncbi:MAG: right-handed parallel beta-helix repeat-containing protein [Planctomycetes bacterium]|nr:right-handed parallel beta-helix repeat-containing protein [Planctomycetota bacterium]